MTEGTSQYASENCSGYEATNAAQLALFGTVDEAHPELQVASPKSPQNVVSKIILMSLKLESILHGELKTAKGDQLVGSGLPEVMSFGILERWK